MATTSLLKKPRLAAGQRALLLNAPAGYLEIVGDLPVGVELSTERDGEYDAVHPFVTHSAELGAMRAGALEAVVYDGLPWVSYPKRSANVETDLSPDVPQAAMADTGWRPVAQVSIDAVWSPRRFRPAERVGA